MCFVSTSGDVLGQERRGAEAGLRLNCVPQRQAQVLAART